MLEYKEKIYFTEQGQEELLEIFSGADLIYSDSIENIIQDSNGETTDYGENVIDYYVSVLTAYTKSQEDFSDCERQEIINKQANKDLGLNITLHHKGNKVCYNFKIDNFYKWALILDSIYLELVSVTPLNDNSYDNSYDFSDIFTSYDLNQANRRLLDKVYTLMDTYLDVSLSNYQINHDLMLYIKETMPTIFLIDNQTMSELVITQYKVTMENVYTLSQSQLAALTRIQEALSQL